MDTKNLIYAAVGAPVAAAKSLNAQAEKVWAQLEGRSGDLATQAQAQIDEWAVEGRKVVSDVSDGKMVDDLAARVDFDQAREQVSKLRDQLEDMLSTWRTSFRPVEEAAGATARSAAAAVEQAADEMEQTVKAKTTTRPATKKPAAKTPAAKKPAAKTPAAKTTAAKKA